MLFPFSLVLEVEVVLKLAVAIEERKDVLDIRRPVPCKSLGRERLAKPMTWAIFVMAASPLMGLSRVTQALTWLPNPRLFYYARGSFVSQIRLHEAESLQRSISHLLSHLL